MDLATLFSTFTQSAFRLEGLPRYTVREEDAAYSQYLRDETIPIGFNKEWLKQLEDIKQRGAQVHRLRLLSEPLSTYEAFEIESYTSNIQVGEVVRSMDRIDWPYTGDFWFFDDKWIARMHYDSDGNLVDVDVHEANEDDKEDVAYWEDIFKAAPDIDELFGRENPSDILE